MPFVSTCWFYSEFMTVSWNKGCWGLSSQVLSSFVAGCPPFLGWLAPFPLLGVPHLPVLDVSPSPILCLVAPPSCAACRSPLSVLDGGEGSLCHRFPTAAETDKILCGPGCEAGPLVFIVSGRVRSHGSTWPSSLPRWGWQVSGGSALRGEVRGGREKPEAQPGWLRAAQRDPAGHGVRRPL